MPKRKYFGTGPNKRVIKRRKMSAGVVGAIIPRVSRGYLRTGGRFGRFGGGSGIGGELKFFDTAHNFTIPLAAAVPATGQLVLIPQGVTESTRVGRECIIQSIQCNYAFQMLPAAAATCSANVVAILIQDTQCNGAAAAVTDVYQNNQAVTAMINLDNSKRFKTIKKFRISLNPGAGATTALNSATGFRKFYKKCNIPIVFSSTTGAITEIRSNNLFMIVGTDSNTATVTLLGNTRVRFSDK